jgi:hypothetical protein
MDVSTFDRLARTLARAGTRRAALGGLLAPVGTALGLGLLREAAAAPKPANAKCSSDAQCASGTCIKYAKCKKNGKLTGKCRCSCSETALCPTGNSCRNGACFSECSSPFVCPRTGGGGCGSGCVCGATDLGDSCIGSTVLCDGNNSCETSADCPTGSVCFDLGGTCVEGCPPLLCANPCGQGFRLPTTSSAATAASQSSTRSTGRKDAVDILQGERH